MVLFPEGVTFTNGEFGTGATCPLFNLLEKPDGDVERRRFCPECESSKFQNIWTGKERRAFGTSLES
jgi:hypothetical protein